MANEDPVFLRLDVGKPGPEASCMGPVHRRAPAIQKARLSKDNMRNGCLFGNFTAEASDHSEVIRRRLIEIFAEVQESVAYCLRAAVQAGELPPDFDCDGAGPRPSMFQRSSKPMATGASRGTYQPLFSKRRIRR